MTDIGRLSACFVGLPATGKTTYVAALWAYLTSGLDGDRYRVSEYPDDPRYLNEIATAWASGAPMPRNSLGATDRIEFTLERPTGHPITVVLPDLPGEVFLDAVRRPGMDEDAADAVLNSELLLVFVSGERAKTFAALGDYASASPVVPREDADDGDGTNALEFLIDALDSDTLNSELLTRIAHLTRDVGLPPILIVVSCWDAHRGLGYTPRDWLSREQPMTTQLVDEWSRATRVGVVGVSAQGANYDEQPEIVRLLANARPWACDEDGTQTDIAGPLVWFDAPQPRE